jgi:hypothetical protein
MKPLEPKLEHNPEPEMKPASLPLPSSKPRRARYSILPVLSHPDDGEWAYLNTALRRSAAKSGITTIDDDDDSNNKYGGLD